MEVVINVCYGGFSLSDKAEKAYLARKPADFDRENFYTRDIPREDPDLVAVVKELGSSANGVFAKLKIVEIPYSDSEGWYIEEYDGTEWVAANHDTWS